MMENTQSNNQQKPVAPVGSPERGHQEADKTKEKQAEEQPKEKEDKSSTTEQGPAEKGESDTRKPE